MDYSKYSLAYEIWKEAKAEIAEHQALQNGGKAIKILPTGDLDAIVFATLDEVKKVADYMDAWAARSPQ